MGTQARGMYRQRMHVGIGTNTTRPQARQTVGRGGRRQLSATSRSDQRLRPPRPPPIVGSSTRWIWIIAGPNSTTSSAGKMQKISGNSSFSAILAAASSARWRRAVRSACACTRSDCASAVPKRSACSTMVTKPSTSSTPVRTANARRARSRDAPARSSRFTNCSSSAKAGLVSSRSLATRTSAASVPSPASTHTVIRSSASGKASMTARCRRRTRSASQTVGAQ